MTQYANTRGLNNYNYVDGYNICRCCLNIFVSDMQSIFPRYSSRMSTCSDPDRPDTDDENSQRSYSNASSPSGSLQQTPNYVSLFPLHGSFLRLSSLSLQVLSASGGQIIAVQNPALSLSGAFPGRGSPPTSSGPLPPATTSMTGILLASRSLQAPAPGQRMSPSNLKQEPGSPSNPSAREPRDQREKE